MSKRKDSRTANLTVKVAGITFRSPVLPAASELVFDGESAERVAGTGVGGIVTKTFTTSPEFRIRLRPYQFPLGHVDPSLRKSGSLFSLASPHVEEMEVVQRQNVPDISHVCKKAGIPLIVSFYERPSDLRSWNKVAKGFERAGADLLELNFSSPTMKGELEKSLKSSFKIIESVTKSSNIPVGIKISPVIEPLADAVKGWAERGASFITAHNAPSGIYIDVEREVPYGAPVIGGYLVGRAFLPVSLARAVQILKSVDLPVFGVGGVFGWSDALQYLLCGCSLVEVGTAAYLEGIGIFEKIHQGIAAWMKRKGYASIADFRGRVLGRIIPMVELKKREIAPYSVPPKTPYRPKIDRKKCILCRTCERACFYRVFIFDAEKKCMATDKDRCWSCGLCVGICPEGAIALVDKSTGRTVWNGKGMAVPFSNVRHRRI
jgi:dihydroorotate dehydrogenase/ferredoxin